MHTREVIEKIERGEYPKNMTLPIIEVGGIEHKYCRMCKTYRTIDKFYSHKVCYCRECCVLRDSIYYKSPAKPVLAEYPCTTCRSYSRQRTSMKVNIGYCMRYRKSVDGLQDTCGEWSEDVKKNFVKVYERNG